MSMESNRNSRECSDEDVNGREEFSFLQETIKEKPITGRMVVNQLGKMAVYGIVFGLMASISFFAIKPWAESLFQKNSKVVTIPRDEEKKEDENEKLPEVEVRPELTLESYRELNTELYGVAKDIGKSIVEVRGIHGKEGWIKESYDTVNSVSGIVVADTGSQFLMLANNSILEEAEDITITFEDGNTYPAGLRKQDKNLGIAIFEVNKSDMKTGTVNQTKVAALGNSNLISRGDMMIALGKPFGYSDGLGYGITSSVRKTITLPDGRYRILVTDIPGSNEGSGFLANIRGEIVGVIQPKITSDEHVCASNALAISDLKELIELLSNGKSIPYVGVTGTEVTEAIKREQGIPVGVYVKNVDSDSPAMAAGIQNGDIITSVEKSKITTLNVYQKAILKYQPGSQIKMKGQRRSNGGYVEIEYTVTTGSKE